VRRAIGVELRERKDRGVNASKRQSWLSKRWNAFIRACLVASNVATSALQCPSAEKISFSRLSRFAALAAISLRSPTSVSLSFFLSSPLAAAALVVFNLVQFHRENNSFSSHETVDLKTTPKKKEIKEFFFFFSRLAGDFPHILLLPISVCGEICQNFVKIWLLLKRLASERFLWTL
jgi:hypothetical protein